jgi:hypothetical protein
MLCSVRTLGQGFLDSGFWYVEFLGFFATNMKTHMFLMILLIIHNLDLTNEFNFMRNCGQVKRNLCYCGLIILLFTRGKAQ